MPDNPDSSRRNFLKTTGVSDNVGGVKFFVSVRTRALRRARHFALLEPQCSSNQGSLVIVSGQKLSSTHASLRSQLRS